MHDTARLNARIENLLSKHPRVIDLSLTRMHAALAALDNPHLKLPPIIHVAGTNGKGSTVAYTRAILEAAGLKVHVYTSPHLIRYTERIRVAGQLIAQQDLEDILVEVMATCAHVPLTVFELLTVAAFAAFANTPADAVILEVGLGGRLDATNVIVPAVSVITPVSIDHTQFLGETIAEIAQEKAGIIKPKIPVILGVQEPEAQDVILQIVARNRAEVSCIDEDFSAMIEEGRFVFQSDDALYDTHPPKLKGAHQIDNAAVAIAACSQFLKGQLSNIAVEMGVLNVKWPARLQALSHNKLKPALHRFKEIWLDGGHNPGAGDVLATAMAQMNDQHAKNLVMIVGMLNTKDPKGFFESFVGLSYEILTVTIPVEPNSFSAVELAAAAQELGLKSAAMPSLQQALNAAAQMGDCRLLLCGSLYLADYILEHYTDYEIV